jgi:ERCC4-type nuclease
MFIKIDSRESDLMINLNLLFKEHSHEIKLESLPVGDIILLNKENKEKVIFERKSLYDLAASIKDGRYKEQSFRLNGNELHNHNIIYVIEGDFEKYNAQKGRLDKKTLYSSLITLNYFKGFSVIRTKNINETCELIINFADKLEKESTRESYYENEKLKMGISIINETNYCEVIKKEKKNNINTENIGEIMLSNIPSVSSKSAITIMKKFTNIRNLIKSLEENENCLDDIKIMCESGMTRKISKPCIENIKKFLLS